jgi:hypothetical protein
VYREIMPEKALKIVFGTKPNCVAPPCLRHVYAYSRQLSLAWLTFITDSSKTPQKSTIITEVNKWPQSQASSGKAV